MEHLWNRVEHSAAANDHLKHNIVFTEENSDRCGPIVILQLATLENQQITHMQETTQDQHCMNLMC